MDCKCCTGGAEMGNSYIVGLWRTICGSYDIAHRQWQSVVSTALLVGHTYQEYHSVCTHQEYHSVCTHSLPPSPPGCRVGPRPKDQVLFLKTFHLRGGLARPTPG